MALRDRREERQWPNFDLNDESVVVIVGSGAGGGTLGTELALKGVKTLILEAGARNEIEDFINDEWASFTQLAWKDMRTTSGSWRVHKDFANLPAWIVKSVGGSTVHWAGASLRFQEHEFKTRTTYGNVAGANLLDWPITLAELEPYYAKAEDKMGVTRTNNIPGLPGNNNFKVLEAGAKKVGYKEVHTGRMAINSQPRDGRGACQQIGFCFQGCKSGAKWSTLYAEIPKGEATGNLEVRPNSQVIQIEHDASGKVTGVVYADKDGKMQRQKARIVAVAGNSLESPRLLLNSASIMFPDGLANSSGQVGRNYMRHTTASVYAVFDKPVRMWRGTTMAGIVRDEAGERHEARLRRRLRAGNPVARLAFHGGLPQSGRVGSRVHIGARTPTKIWRACGSSARTCRRRQIASRSTRSRRTSLACPSQACISTITPTTSRCAITLGRAARRFTKRWARPASSRHRPIPRRTISAPTGWRRTARDGVVNAHGQTHDIKNLFVSDGSQFTTGGAENPTLTIVALAIRQADYIAEQMGKNTI